ncbi:MAG: glutamate formimidoyltransferase [Candidatus Xenobium sp.]|nr:glutamate formimidoyltransferase [Burkholderiales bacterium]
MDESFFQCIPNVSEGRRTEVVAAFVEAIRDVPGAHLLDYSSDRDHHRSVFTLVGKALPLRKAILAMYEVAGRHLNLARHSGAHPRIGAVDVVPFVPLHNTPMQAACALALEVAQAVTERFEVPIYLYEECARIPERRSLAWLRRGGLEALEAEISTPLRRPDLGPARLHPLLGASVIGARKPLLAFNVLLDTEDVEVARAIAHRVRERGGGLSNLRALGIFLAERGRAQVSMNLVDPERTPWYLALEMVRMEARRFGTRILSTEVIGMPPLSVVAEAAAYYMQWEGFSLDRILEHHLLRIARDEALDGVAARAPGQEWPGNQDPGQKEEA